jgi:hypothetical protein
LPVKEEEVMTKRKKRNAITLISLLLALAALIGVYYWYNNRPTDTKDTDNKSETISLSKVEKEQINRLHYKYEDADLILVKEGDLWKSQSEPDRPINQDYIKRMLTIISDINAERLITEAPENLSDFGLEEPTSYLQASLADGSTVTLQIGNEVSTKTGYYALVNEDGKVYLLSSSNVYALQYNNTEMNAKEEAPKIEAANIKHIIIDQRDGEDFELLYDDQGKHKDSSGAKNNFWYILKPYKEGYTANASSVSALQANYTSLSYLSCVEYDAQDLSKYGLDNPMASIYLGYNEVRTEKLENPETDPETGKEISEKTYQEPKEYKLYVGNKDEDGNYYVKAEGSKAVHTMDDVALDKMLTVDVFSLINNFVNIPNIDTVEKIDIKTEASTHKIELKRSTEKNEDGKDETKTTYFFDGKEVEEDPFKKFYQVIISAMFDAEIKTEVQTQGVQPLLSMTYYLTDGTTASASYLPYDDSFYIIDSNDETRFFADKRRIDNIINKIKEFEASK